MLPQGVVWQQLRQQALDTVPAGSLVPFHSPPTLEAWLRTGAFSVAATTSKSFLLHGASEDIGAALYSDASYHVDHALEQSVSIRHQIATGMWQSSAWTAVTFYYWAYYLTLALTRLLGHTAWYVSQSAAAALKMLAMSGTGNPGAGAYVISCGSAISSSQREIVVKRASQSRVHDAVWHLWGTRLRELTKGVAKSKNSDPEARMYLAQVAAANVLGDGWPSDLRNLVNYAPGVGYGAVRNSTPAAVFGTISVDPPSSVAEIVDRLEGNVAGLTSALPLKSQIAVATRVLVDTCFVLNTLVAALANEVGERRGLDRRWRNARLRFLRLQAEPYAEKEWPCRDVAAA